MLQRCESFMIRWLVMFVLWSLWVRNSKDWSSKEFRLSKIFYFGLYASTEERECPVCGKDHVWSCIIFLSLTVKERFRKVVSRGLCFLCLGSSHMSNSCKKGLCKHCKGRHHHLLHTDKPIRPDIPETSPTSQEKPAVPVVPKNVVASSVATSGSGKVILQTVPAMLCGSNGNSKVVRCFLDSGSQTSFVRQSVVEELGLDGPSIRIAISGFGGKQEKTSLRKRISCTLAPVENPRHYQEIEALTTAQICCPADAVEVSPKNWSHLQDLKFPEEFPREEMPIDVLVGLDFYYLFVSRDIVKGSPSEPVAVRTTLGWVLCGPAGNGNQESAVSMNVQVSTNDQLNETLQAFWELESIGIKSEQKAILTHSEEAVLTNFKESLVFKEGRYEVSLPWKEKQVTLKNNYHQAERRLYSLEKRLLEDPAKAKLYKDAINKYVEDGVAEEVPANQTIPSDIHPVFYLPHHVVIREDHQKTKTRIVFDASAKDSNGKSLNSCIESGPALQPDLCAILLRFRKKKVAVMGDIEKMFLQIGLKEEDRDSHRYLWRDLNLDITPKVYRMTRVTFGVIASPFLAICTTQEHARRYQDVYPEAADEILKNIYVDDFVFCRDEVQEAVQLQQSAKELMELAAFNLTKWSSNSPEVMETIPVEEKAAASPVKLEISTSPESSSITKALGLKWDTRRDCLTFIIEMDGIKSQAETYTKREVASCAAKVFDPIGLITPFTVRAKILFQILWTQGIGWDDEISTETCRKWSKWLQEISDLEKLNIPRYYLNGPMSEHSRLELRTFGDASELAYASAVYLRAVSEEGQVSTSLVMSKTRVAPVKKVILPRLELMAAVIILPDSAPMFEIHFTGLSYKPYCLLDRQLLHTTLDPWIISKMETLCCKSCCGNTIIARSFFMEILPRAPKPS